MRSTWLALLALTAIALATTHACDRDGYPHTAPGFVRVGDHHIAVWQKVTKKGTTLQAAAFASQGRQAGRTIWDSDELQSAPVLAGGDQSALVLALEGPNPDPDPDKDREDPPRFLTTLAIGPDARELGPRRSFGMVDRICSSPAWDGQEFLVGVAYRLRRFGSGTVLHLVSISADGVPVHEERIASGPFWGCSLARHGDVTALVVTAENPEHRGYSLVAFLISDRGIEGPIALATEERMPWPDIVSDPAGGWAVAYAGKDDAVRLVRFDRDGAHSSTLLDGVDADTMSLGSNAAGVFVSWHARGKIQLRGVDTNRTRSLGRASRAQTSAIGFDRECAIAWRDRNDKYAVMASAACP